MQKILHFYTTLQNTHFHKLKRTAITKKPFFCAMMFAPRGQYPTRNILYAWLETKRKRSIMTNNIESIMKCVEMGIFTKEQGAELIKKIVDSSANAVQPTVQKKATEAKAPQKKLTAEEREAKKQAKTEAWKAEKKAWAEAHYTEAEREAFKKERDAKRAEAKKKHLAYCQTNAHFGNKKVSKEEWHKKYEEYLKKAK